jgi:REP element-mobilizing transposase RayT
LEKSVAYCRNEKGMELYGYCFMPNHVHLIYRSAKGDPAGLIRDFKKHTSKEVINAIVENPQESRKEWLLWMFEKAGKSTGNVAKHQFWQHPNHPIELWSMPVLSKN